VSGLDARTVRRRYLVLRGLRWLPTGLLMPVMVLLMTDRGFTLTTIGIATAMQGVVVLCLELPTGGLADALGRRPVLLGATTVDLAAAAIFALWARSLPVLMLVWALQGVYRALESGPLDAWYVDAALDADPHADIEATLGHAGAAVGAAIAVGSITSSVLVAAAPFPRVDPLVGPLVVYLVLRVVEVTLLAVLMSEARTPVGLGGLTRTVRDVPVVVAAGVRVVRRSRALLALVAVELFWGFGMVTWETLLPPHLEQAVGSADRAAALLGPVGAGAWVASGVAAGLVPRVARRFGAAPTAAAMRVGQGLTVLAMALAAGPVGMVAAYVATYGIHGAANPVHQGMLHREVDGPHRTTVLSVNSMVAMPAGAIGGIALGALADGTSITTAMVVGAAMLAVAAPLYLVARSASRASVVSSTSPREQRSTAQVSASP
jgi:predicted MFS family arabinose efflux permease